MVVFWGLRLPFFMLYCTKFNHKRKGTKMKHYIALISDIDHPVIDTLLDSAKEGKILVEAARLAGHKYIVTAGEETGKYIKGFIGMGASSIDQIEDSIEYVSQRMSDMKLPTGEWAVFMTNSKDDCNAVFNILKNKFKGTEYKPSY